ncbi:MAG TPA: hypothetical protein PKD84_09390 [Propionicimonas sp.]|nr:hypothetical protein [Propionicimonas sp.]
MVIDPAVAHHQTVRVDPAEVPGAVVQQTVCLAEIEHLSVAVGVAKVPM